MIAKLCITVFLTQLVFIFCRTWNVRCISKHDITGALISGGIVHIAWLISIAIGAVSMNKIISNFQWEHIPVVACSLAGGLIGTYYALSNKYQNDKN